MLEKAEAILKTNDVPWKDRYMGIALSSVLKQVVQSYDGYCIYMYTELLAFELYLFYNILLTSFGS